MNADGNNLAPNAPNGPNAQPVNLKIENVKIPDFHGVPSKDSTTAQSLIQRINNLSQANNWDTTVAFHHFAIALKSSAQKWLEWQMLCVDGATPSWEWIEPLFREEFATQSDDANILDQLSHLKMKHDENVRDLYSRVFDIRRILGTTKTREAQLPTPNGQGLYTEQQLRDFGKSCDNIYADHVQTQLFKHALPVDIKLAVNLAKPNNSVEAYKVANMQFQTMQAKKHISELSQEEEIDAVRPNFRPQGNFRQSNAFQKSNNQKAWQPRQQNSTSSQKPFNSTNQRTGNNSNKNGITCVYCKKQGHHQDDCRSRIRDNAPCIANSGKTYFPKKVNEVTNESTVNNITHSGFH